MATELSAGLVLVHGSRALVIRIRADVWEIPKGHVEEGESLEQAAMRELLEETGMTSPLLVVREGALREIGELSYSFEKKDGARVDKRVVYFAYAINEQEPVFEPPKATRELYWVNVEEARRIALVNDDLRPILLEALRVPN